MVERKARGSILKVVIWAQGLSCFVLWIAYGVWQTRRSASVRRWAFGVPRAQRAIWGAGLFLGGAALLLVAFLGIAAGKGLSESGLTPWAWAVVAFVGLAYAHCQTLATALLVSLAQQAVQEARQEEASASSVTPRNSETSDSGGV